MACSHNGTGTGLGQRMREMAYRIYRLQKVPEGNIFTGVCLSFCWGKGVPGPNAIPIVSVITLTYKKAFPAC